MSRIELENDGLRVVIEADTSLKFDVDQLTKMSKGVFTKAFGGLKTVLLVGYDENSKILAVKGVRNATGLSLNEAKELVDKAEYEHVPMIQGVTSIRAHAIVKTISQHGCVCLIVPDGKVR